MKRNRKDVSKKSPAAPDDAAARERPDREQSGRERPLPIVGVGASAGGLEAYTDLLKHLPVDSGMAFVLVQHLDPQHDSALVQLMSRATLMPVREATNGQKIEPDRVYVIPPNTNLSIERGALKLQPRKQGRTPHHSIDAFFESLAADQRERAIGVVLSGTANDGTLGLEAIKAEGGITFAQDESARHDSMPKSAVAAGCVDFVLPPKAIAAELARIAAHPHVAGELIDGEQAGEMEEDGGSVTAHQDDDTPLPSGHERGAKVRDSRHEARAARHAPENGYKKVLLLLRNHSGVDFSLYKSTTIQRRITRRMALSKHFTLDEYSRFLRGNARELDSLFSDALIGVTSFFRNPEAFEALAGKVFPKILKQKSHEPVRIWVLGCSTGQEAYSIAMEYTEAAEKSPRGRRLQVFATDLNNALLDKARHGLYAKSIDQDVSPERLRRFFVEEQGGYRVVKSLREMVVFARQNLIGDPPFSRMDLISCRNLLIYLEPSLQKKAIPTFHYALKPDGFLLLGASESIGGFTDLFEIVERKQKIYSKKAAPATAFHLPIGKRGEWRGARDEKADEQRESPHTQHSPLVIHHSTAAHHLPNELNAQREADRVTVNQFAPPGVLINAELQVLQFRGPTGAYLQPPTGKASFDVLKMAREGLMLPLRAAINKAKKENKAVRKENVRIQHKGKTTAVHLKVIPLKNVPERCFLVVFEDADAAGQAARAEDLRQKVPLGKRDLRESPGRIAELETELSETRDYLLLIQEQHEAANEELQASSEEVQSANEELQSINEELETSKEELESANEELMTLNEELGHRNIELNRAIGDLVNLQASTRLAIVLVGRDLAIRGFSPDAERQFNLQAGDLGRPLRHLRHNLDLADLEGVVAEVVAAVRETEREVRDEGGRWYSLRVRPYLTLDNRVDGAVLVLVDIDDLKQSERAIAAARDVALNTIDAVRDPLLVLDGALRVESANRAFYRDFQVAADETVGRLVFELGNRQWDIPRLRHLLEEILPQSAAPDDFLVEHDFERLGPRAMLLNARRIDDPAGGTSRILLAIEDVTQRMRHDQATVRLAAIVESTDDAIVGKDLHGVIETWNAGAQRLFGYSAQEVVGKFVTLLIPPDRADEEPEILRRLAEGKTIDHYETVRRRKDGSLIDVSLTVSPIRDGEGKIVGASKIARDITARKQADEALRESHAQLEARADELARFNQVAVGRELRMIELKRQINELCRQSGKPEPYPLEFEGE